MPLRRAVPLPVTATAVALTVPDRDEPAASL
jgi:hypothetical protein